MNRNIDWRSYLNRLTFCYGCGKFGMPAPKKSIPTGWRLIYQPHPDGRSGLHICSDDCHEAVRAAMMQGPVTEPLMLPDPRAIMMPTEVRQAMEDEVRGALEEDNDDDGADGDDN